MKIQFDISYYHDYISPTLAQQLLAQAHPIAGIEGLACTSQPASQQGSLETPAGLQFLTTLYQKLHKDLAKVLAQRAKDRSFIDERVRASYEFNQNHERDFLDKNYKTIIGLQDSLGRTVVGPLQEDYCNAGGSPVAPIPKYLQGAHITLFGPPDSAKMAINAMNAYHRKLPGEPSIVEQLLATHESVPKWGADDEDSKTPLHADLVDAGANLTACFEGHLSLEESGKKYALAADHLSVPIKRFPGLALPCTFLFYRGNPIPLHMYDFALHLFKNWQNKSALCFYVPKLENEEEAQYIHKMVQVAEQMIQEIHPSYELGTVRLMIVLENPRAILRAHEIMDALHPYFVGASLGWHDYLASTARIFKEDANYRIPVKADPDIVIKYIKASHLLLADAVGSRGGIKVGGMYGILPMKSEIKDPSFQVTLKGFFKDVITQLKRNLTGFWVAHPDFVRIGLATVEAWKFHQQGNPEPLQKLTSDFLVEPYRSEVLNFITGPDIEGLNKTDPNYVRSLLVADIKESDFIANNHPDEIRYNVFQSLQYLTDWLSGNGCVALPTTINGLSVRVMDDLATAERSRWEVWHELYHGRFDLARFIQIAHEEMHFIRKDLSHQKKIVQVKWDERTAQWYPIALRLMLQLMTQKNPAEFATELLLPFTTDVIRNSKNPWETARSLNPGKFELYDEVEKLNYYFERCGCLRFAQEMASGSVLDTKKAKSLIENFSVEEIIEAASFHGNIGESRKTLDAMAALEQAQVAEDLTATQLRSLGETYLKKFGFKFLISAKQKKGEEMLQSLQQRLNNSVSEEIANAKKALYEITLKRFVAEPLDDLQQRIHRLIENHGLKGGLAIAVSSPKMSLPKAIEKRLPKTTDFATQSLTFGQATKENPVTKDTFFELASLSKTLAAAFVHSYFAEKKISLSTPANQLFQTTTSCFRVKSSVNPAWGDQVTLEHLMSHHALNMHYVNGFPLDTKLPTALELLTEPGKFNYPPIDVPNEPSTIFKYSGGGFLVLEHLIEALEGKTIQELTGPFLARMSLSGLTFEQGNLPQKNYAHAYSDQGLPLEVGRLKFPAFAAGAMGTAEDMQKFLLHLTSAYHNLEGSASLSHDTAVQMLFARDLGAKEFMGCLSGQGVFVAEAGDNKLILHQGANEGFRALYLHCVSGPDCGKGFTIFCNADNKGVLLVAEVAQLLLQHLKFTGINTQEFNQQFDYSQLPQEQIVNLGYKNLLFKNFLPTMAAEIKDKGPRSPLSDYNVAVGAQVFSVTNQRFARAENLLSPFEPTFDPDLFCPQGKIMDSWETARHNSRPCDSLSFQITKPATLKYVSFSTKYHDGNQAEHVSLWARNQEQEEWQLILPKSALKGHSILQVELASSSGPWKQFRVDLFPDGGLSRIGLFEDLPANQRMDFKKIDEAQCVRYTEPILKSHKPLTIAFNEESQKNPEMRNSKIDWASQAFGGRIVSATNEHYGPAVQVISPFPALHMFDGLESARSREKGHSEEVVIALGKEIFIEEIIFDFKHFVNNNPVKVQVQGLSENNWINLTDNIFVKPYAGNLLRTKILSVCRYSQIKVRTVPDGGINRIHVYGH